MYNIVRNMPLSMNIYIYVQDTVVDREGSTADSMQLVAIYRFSLHRMYTQRDMRRHT